MDTFLRLHQLFEAGKTPAHTECPSNTPAELAEVLTGLGSNAYAGGFFRFVVPQTYTPYFELVGLDPAECCSFLKCGFGHLLFYHRNQYKVLDPIFNSVDVLGEAGALAFVLDIVLCDRAALENSFMIDVYEQAFPQLGAPNADEMYAFVPALRVGGARDVANVRRSPIAVELPILLQV